jgi:hypothetical protein
MHRSEFVIQFVCIGYRRTLLSGVVESLEIIQRCFVVFCSSDW